MQATFMALFMVCVALSTKLNWFCSFFSPSSPSSSSTESFLLDPKAEEGLLYKYIRTHSTHTHTHT